MTTGDGDAGGRLFPEDLDGVDPVAAVMLADACRSIAAYPELIVVGTLFAAAEEMANGWQVVCPCDPLPQGARELLAEHLGDRAALAGATEARELLAAARSLENEPRDELRVAGHRFRIVRIEQAVRTGPDGPEPPRPTDLDPHPADRRPLPARSYDMLPMGHDVPDTATAELLCQLLDATARTGSEPSEAYLTPVLLTPAFTMAEKTGGRWRPVGRLHDTPQEARQALATYFRHVVPAVEHPGEEEAADYAEAADLLIDQSRRNGIAVAGRRFRVIRIERITLMSPEGPEPPRTAD
ncbi:hypothetical protein J4573_35850 [Actinomadura barringtoniae]|uniref:PE-PGRS family protein n=1 Tax=Actinomadura barringtoniae TaxID=1427535 RepID=A0A939TAJ2_9ACTN|nr:DUF5954 family protein [Actinomadura barringtoniae]MBO2452512.1 hypothetical protein [Actinomadura barringtoniae]